MNEWLLTILINETDDSDEVTPSCCDTQQSGEKNSRNTIQETVMMYNQMFNDILNFYYQSSIFRISSQLLVAQSQNSK